MATTINYELAAAKKATAAEAQKLVIEARRLVMGFRKRGLVERVGRILDHPSKMGEWGGEWFVTEDREQPGMPCWPRVTATEGWMFEVEIGKGCWPLRIALCRYPAQYTAWDGVVIPTNIPPHYHFDSRVETEGAVLHGTKHFIRCHRTVIEILEALRPLGFLKKMEDEDAGYWPNGLMPKLREHAKHIAFMHDVKTGVELWHVLKAAPDPESKTKKKGANDADKSPLYLHQQYREVRQTKQLSRAEQDALRKARRNFGSN